MPIREYVCINKSCNHKMETLQKINEEPLKTCPVCEQETLKGIISPSSFRLPGRGWYKPTSSLD